MNDLEDLVQGFKPKDAPEDKPIDKPEDKPIDKPVDKPTDKPEDKPEDKPLDYLSALNKDLGTEFENLESFKSYINDNKGYKNKYEEAESTYKTKLSDFEAQVKLLEEKVNPLSHFNSKEDYLAEVLKKKHSDKDVNILSSIAKGNTGETEFDTAAMKYALDIPGIEGGIDGAKEMVASELGVDTDSEDWQDISTWSLSQRNKLKMLAYNAKKDFSSLTEGIELPEQLTGEQLLQNKREQEEQYQRDLISGWSEIETSLKNYDGIKIDFKDKDGSVTENFSFTADDKFKDEFSKSFSEKMIKIGIDPKLIPAEELVREREKEFVVKNLPNILKSYRSTFESKMREEYDKKYNNTTPLEDRKPGDTTKKDVGQHIDNMFNQNFKKFRK